MSSMMKFKKKQKKNVILILFPEASLIQLHDVSTGVIFTLAIIDSFTGYTTPGQNGPSTDLLYDLSTCRC